MEQVLKVRTSETDGDETGAHWTVHYVLFETVDEDRDCPCFDLFDDDGRGNGKQICRGWNRNAMVSLALRLGAFVEWRPQAQAVILAAHLRSI